MAKNPNAKWQELANRSEQARKPFDKDMLLNLAFYLGEQYVEWKDDIATIRRVQREERQLNTPRPIVNKLMHFAGQAHSQALSTKPTADVLPATDGHEDISTTSVASAWLSWLTDPTVESWDAKLSEATFWSVVCGPAYIKWTYDQAQKRPVITPCSPLDIILDPYISSFREARFIIHRKFMDPEQVFERFGAEVKPTDTVSADPVRAELLRQMGYSGALSGCVVYELWYKPCRRFPKGKLVTWTGNTTLIDTDFPYEHGHLPFTQIGWIPRPGTPHYHSALYYLRPAQMELNKYHAQRIQIREGFANPKWFLDSQINLNNLPDDSPMQILIGDSRGGQLKPEIIQPTGMADNNEGEWLTREMGDIVGQHAVLEGQAPGRVEAFKALELLKESDTSRLAELTRTIDVSMAEGFWQSLMLARQYMTEEQIVQTYSREGVPEVHKFMTENFKPGMRIRVTRQSGLASSRGARQEQLLLLWQNRVIQDPKLMAELMELPIPSFVQATAYDIRLARNENLTLANGTPITPNSWDDHESHIAEHNNYRKTSAFVELPTKTKTMFEHHVTEHESLLQASVMKQVEQQQAVQSLLQGGQAPPGGQPAPAPEPAPAEATPPA